MIIMMIMMIMTMIIKSEKLEIINNIKKLDYVLDC